VRGATRQDSYSAARLLLLLLLRCCDVVQQQHQQLGCTPLHSHCTALMISAGGG